MAWASLGQQGGLTGGKVFFVLLRQLRVFGCTRLQRLQHHLAYQVTRVPFAVCRKNEPRAVRRGGGVDGLFLQFLVFVPVLALFQIAG